MLINLFLSQHLDASIQHLEEATRVYSAAATFRGIAMDLQQVMN